MQSSCKPSLVDCMLWLIDKLSRRFTDCKAGRDFGNTLLYWVIPEALQKMRVSQWDLYAEGEHIGNEKKMTIPSTRGSAGEGKKLWRASYQNRWKRKSKMGF